MKTTALSLALLANASAYAPQSRPKINVPKMPELKNVALSTFAAATIASNVFMPVADAADFMSPFESSTNVVAVKEIRQGEYKEYEVDVTPQAFDKAESTFKSAKETKSKKGKYTALLGVLVVGSFIIPMAQYFWYVKDDDSSDNFFAQKQAPPPAPEPPKKKKWF